MASRASIYQHGATMRSEHLVWSFRSNHGNSIAAMSEPPSKQKPPRPPATPGSARRLGGAKHAESKGQPQTAFDLWLERGLHRLFDGIAAEPIPDALLKIIEQDRSDG